MAPNFLKNGIFCFGPSFFVSAAFIMSIISSSLCNYVKLDEDNIWRTGGLPLVGLSIDTIGFWCYEPVNLSGRYDMSDVDFDTNFKYARAFGTTANSLGFVVWLVYLFAACCPYPPATIIFTGFLAFCATVFEGFKWWILKSTFWCDGDALGCSMDTAGKVGISAAACWFVATLMTCAHGAERMKANKNRDEGEGGGEAYDDA